LGFYDQTFQSSAWTFNPDGIDEGGGMIELVTIVSSLNRATLLKEALSSLARVLPKLPLKAAVVVLDAGSHDGSQKIVRNGSFPVPIHLVEAPGLSFAAGVNRAVKTAAELYPSAKYFFLFETDNFLASAEPLTHALQLMARRETLAGIGFTVRRHDGSEAGFGRNHPEWFEFVLGPQLAFRMGLDRPRLKWKRERGVSWAECDVVYSSPILVRREAWEMSGGFDVETFPFSDCDLDWARRLQQLGLAQAVVETSDVVHDNQQCESSWSAARALHFHRARFRLLRKRYGADMHALLPLVALRHIAELLVAAANVRKSGEYRGAVTKRWNLFVRSLKAYR
jgi:GT2 family glycosyltransferase